MKLSRACPLLFAWIYMQAQMRASSARHINVESSYRREDILCSVMQTTGHATRHAQEDALCSVMRQDMHSHMHTRVALPLCRGRERLTSHFMNYLNTYVPTCDIQ